MHSGANDTIKKPWVLVTVKASTFIGKKFMRYMTS